MTTVNFQVVKNDTFNPGWYYVLKKNRIVMDLTGCSVKADFKLEKTYIVALSMDDTNGKIIIKDGPNGQIQFGNQIISIDSGKYNYDIQLTFPDTSIKTYIHGTMTVVQDITDS